MVCAVVLVKDELKLSGFLENWNCAGLVVGDPLQSNVLVVWLPVSEQEEKSYSLCRTPWILRYPA